MQLTPARRPFGLPRLDASVLDETLRRLSARAVLWLAATMVSLPLLVRLYAGSMARWAGDDWCCADIANGKSPWGAPHGFFALQAAYYQDHFGRWASTALLTGAGHLGPWSAPVLAVLGLLLFA